MTCDHDAPIVDDRCTVCGELVPEAGLVRHNVPRTVVVLAPELLARVESLVSRAEQMPPVTLDSIPEIDVVLSEVASLYREIEACRKAAKAPILEAGQAVDRAAARVLVPLDDWKRKWTKDIGDIKVEEDRKARAAEAERRRVEREHAEREAELQRLAAGVTTAEDAKAVAELRKEVRDQGARQWVEAQRTPIASVKSSVRVAMIDEVEIVDADLVPSVVNGITIRPIDTSAVKRLLSANVEVPGARLVKKPRAAQHGSRRR